MSVAIYSAKQLIHDIFSIIQYIFTFFLSFLFFFLLLFKGEVKNSYNIDLSGNT